MNNLPWFPLDAKQWLVGTAGMTKSEKGVFIDLLCYQWENGSLSSIPNRLPIECADEWAVLRSKFTESTSGELVNPKLHKIRLEKESILDKQVEGGRKGARSRYGSLTGEAISSKSQNKNQNKNSESELEIEPSEKKKGVSTANAVQGIVNLYNEHCPSLPRVQRMSKIRKQKVSARLKDYPEDEPWIELFKKVEASDYATGRIGKWRASFDWLLNENNIIKVLEGNYDNRGKSEKDGFFDGIENVLGEAFPDAD